MQLSVPTAAAMEELGSAMAMAARSGLQIHLSGSLGAGKTTLVRGFLHGLGYSGNVKSPTFTLVEPYQFDAFSVFHFDFYRIEDPAELEAIGFRDYTGEHAICLMEWPEKAGACLEEPDIRVQIGISGSTRDVRISAGAAGGNSLITKLSSVFPG